MPAPERKLAERLRLWLERDRRGAGYHLRDAASGEAVAWDDPRIVVVPVAGVSFRPEAVADQSFDPGRPLALVPEPGNEHDPNAIEVLAGQQQIGWVPRELAAELAPELDAGRPWSAVVLRVQCDSPRDPPHGATMLLAAAPSVELRGYHSSHGDRRPHRP